MNPLDTIRSAGSPLPREETPRGMTPKTRNPREEVLYVGDEVKKKFTTKSQFKEKHQMA